MVNFLTTGALEQLLEAETTAKTPSVGDFSRYIVPPSYDSLNVENRKKK